MAAFKGESFIEMSAVLCKAADLVENKILSEEWAEATLLWSYKIVKILNVKQNSCICSLRLFQGV